MDQECIINQLSDCLDHHKVIKLQIEWLDGKLKNVLLEPYIIGESPACNWTFIYGKDSKNNKLVSIPAPFIISVEETADGFIVAEKDKCFFVLDFEKHKIVNNIPEVQIVDISEPEDKDEDDEVLSCPFCKEEYNCEHLVFEYDLSFNEFVAGRHDEFYAIRKVIEDIFLDAITKKSYLDFTNVPSYVEKNWYGYGEYFKELWNSAYLQEDDSVYINADVFPRLIEHMYIDFRTCYEMRKKAYPEEAYAPGFDSAMLGYYAEDPSILLKDTAMVIKEYLEEILKNDHTA